MKLKFNTFLTSIIFIFILSQNLLSKTGQSIDSWMSMADAVPSGNGPGACIVYAERYGTPQIYNIRGNTTGFGIYDINTNVWVSTTPLPYASYNGAAMTWDGSNFIYMLLGGTTFYQFDISAATFTRLADPPGSLTSGAAIVYVSTQVGFRWCYAFKGGANVLWRYNIDNDSWETLTGPGAATNAGSELLWTGDEFIYAFVSGATPVLRRYNINTNSWTNLANTPTTIGAGASLTWDGVLSSSNIYATKGADSESFWKYSISDDQWVWISSTPATIGTNSGNRLARYGDYIYCRRGVTNNSFWRYRWRDVDPPGKITGFVAEASLNGGEINLSWVCPGNDKVDENTNAGDLPQGSTFYIQYSSFTENVVFSTSSPQNVYEIWIPTGPVSQGQVVGYTVGGLEEGVTYYFRIWAKDNAGNWSEISDGATAQVTIGNSVVGTISYNGERSTGTFWVFATTIPINQGGGPVALSSYTAEGQTNVEISYILKISSQDYLPNNIYVYAARDYHPPYIEDFLQNPQPGVNPLYGDSFGEYENNPVYLEVNKSSQGVNITIFDPSTGTIKGTLEFKTLSQETTWFFVVNKSTPFGGQQICFKSVNNISSPYNYSLEYLPDAEDYFVVVGAKFKGDEIPQQIRYTGPIKIQNEETIEGIDFVGVTSGTIYCFETIFGSNLKFDYGISTAIVQGVNPFAFNQEYDVDNLPSFPYNYSLEFLPYFDEGYLWATIRDTTTQQGLFYGYTSKISISESTKTLEGINFVLFSTQLSSSAVSGIVLSTNNVPLEGAEVKILNSSEQEIVSTTADSLGKYLLTFPAGSGYKIRVSSTEYTTQIQDISVSQSQTLILNFSLETKQTASILGTITYSATASTGTFYVWVSTIGPYNNPAKNVDGYDVIFSTETTQNSFEYILEDLIPNCSYWIMATRDYHAPYYPANNSIIADPKGIYSSTPVYVNIGENLNGKNFTIYDPSTISGKVIYDGVKIGSCVVLCYTNENLQGDPVNSIFFEINSSGEYNYDFIDLYLCEPTSYYLFAWLDCTEPINFQDGPSTGDVVGVYGGKFLAGSGIVEPADPIFLTFDVSSSNVNILLDTEVVYPPIKPQGLTAIDVSTYSILWQWDIVENATYYQIYNADNDQLIANIEGKDTTTYLELGLSPNTLYKRYVKSGNLRGLSEASDTVQKYTLANPPTELQVVSVSSYSISLSWNSNGNPNGTKYGIIRSQNNFISTTTIKVFDDNYTLDNFTDTSLFENLNYQYKICAYNEEGVQTEYTSFVSTKTNEAPGNLLTNGGFELDLTSWSTGGTAFFSTHPINVISGDYSGKIGYTTATGKKVFYQNIQVISGRNYLLTGYVFKNDSNISQIGLGIRNNGGSMASTAWDISNSTLTSANSSLWQFLSFSTRVPANVSVLGVNLLVNFSNSNATTSYFDNIRFVELPDNNPPSAITDLVVSAGDNEGEIVLTWSAPSDDDTELIPFFGNYVIKYSSVQIIKETDFDEPNFAHRVVIVSTHSVQPNTNVSYILNLNPGTSYWFAIKSTDSYGNTSIWKSSADLNTMNLNAYGWCRDLSPLAPSNIEVIPSGNSILISWDAVGVSDLDYYELWCDSTTPYDFTDQFIATTTKNTSFLHTGLENYVTYYYCVRAVDLPPTVLYSDFSASASTYPIPTPPFAPSLSYDLTETTTWQIKWILTDNSGNEEYLYISSDTNILARLWSSEGLAGYGGTTFWIETGFTPNQQVTRYAEAYNQQGSSWSSAVSLYTKANPPTELSFYFVGQSSVGIKWSNNSNPNYTRYEISYSLDNFQTHFSTPIKFSDNFVYISTIVYDLKPGGVRYYFRVRSVNEDGVETNFSSIVSTTTQLGIENPDFEQHPLVGWSKVGTQQSNIISTTTQKNSGSYSCLFKDPTSLYTSMGIRSSTFVVIPGISYKIGAYFYVQKDSGTSTISASKIQLGIEWLNSNGVIISTSTSADLTLQNFDTWEFLVSTFTTIPQNTVYGRILIRVKETTNYDNDIYVDDVVIEIVPVPIPPPQPLSKPQGLKAKRILDGTKAEISWESNPEQNVEYNLYKSTIADVNNMFLIITTQQLSYNDTDYLDLATTYYYVLKAKKDTQESEFSDICVLPSDNIKPIIEHKGLTSRMLAKKPLYLKVVVKDYLSEVGDDQGRIYYLKGKVRTKDKPTTTQDLSFSPQLSGYPTYYYAEAEMPQEIVSNDGIEYYLEVSDGRWKVYWPSAEEEKYYIVEPPKDKPEQKFITPKNPEVVFGKEVDEVVIRDYNGNEIWKQKSDGVNIIVWRGEDQGGKKIESGAYIYQIKTKDGKRKYGVVIVVK